MPKVQVEARQYWNPTGIQLVKGNQYIFTSQGTWHDASNECSATGYTSKRLRWFEWMRREPGANWFSLIGRIDKRRESQFDIGHLIEQGSTYVATASGTLYCYANDVRFMYWNNKGTIDLEVTQVED